jgi:hypothetical protein
MSWIGPFDVLIRSQVRVVIKRASSAIVDLLGAFHADHVMATAAEQRETCISLHAL